MKKLSITTIGALAALTVFGASELAAQGSVPAQGTVQGAAVWGTAQALNFGDMTPMGTTPDRTIDLLSTVEDATNGNAGTIDVRLNKNGTTIGFSLPQTLDGALGGNTLTVNGFECGFAVGADATTEPTPAPGTTADLDDYAATCTDATEFTVANLAGARLVRVYLGGEILGSEIDNALADDYTGTISITAAIP